MMCDTDQRRQETATECVPLAEINYQGISCLSCQRGTHFLIGRYVLCDYCDYLPKQCDEFQFTKKKKKQCVTQLLAQDEDGTNESRERSKTMTMEFRQRKVKDVSDCTLTLSL